MSDITMTLIARQILHEHPGGKILYGINISRMVPDEVTADGGVPIMHRVGHSFFKTTMKETTIKEGLFLLAFQNLLNWNNLAVW